MAEHEESCPVLQLSPPDVPVEGTVQILEALLADVRSGHVRSVAFATVNRLRCVATGYHLEEKAGLVPAALVGALERLKLRILSEDEVG